MNYIESGAGSLIPFVWVSCMEEGSRKKEVGEGMACASREGGNTLFFLSRVPLAVCLGCSPPTRGVGALSQCMQCVFFLKTEHAL